MNNFDAAGDGQRFPGGQGLVDRDGLQSFLGIEEQPAQHLPQQTWRRPRGPEWTSILGYWDI